MNKLKIYLGDMTYDTISISTEAIPLGIGYIAAYCNKIHNSKVEITLFKYIEELENAIINSPPDILGLSNYTWNHNIGLEMFKLAKNKNPDVLTVWGGPNFPIDFPSQQAFMLQYASVDVYIPFDAELGFTNLITIALSSKEKNLIRNTVSSKPIDGCIIKTVDGKLHHNNIISNPIPLDDIPSPYLTGLFDKFFDGRLSPLIQTNRGCPFQCTFCVDGNDEKQKINQFNMERVISELNYIGKHINDKTNLMMIADVNFGMMPRDYKICIELTKIQKKYSYPKKIDCSTGKNSKEKIIRAIKILNGALMIKLSVQSTNSNVLRNIKRDNISIKQMLELIPTIKKSKLPSLCEIILGLPGDSYDTCVKTIQDMISLDLDEYRIYVLNLLYGSMLSTPSERKKWNFTTKFRILPRSFVRLQNGKNIVETEEIVVGSNSLSFNDYLQLRLMTISLFITNQPAFKPIIKFLRQNDVDIFHLFAIPINSSDNIKKLFERIKNDIINELWDSPDELVKNYQIDREYDKLLNEQSGFNISRFYHALIIANYMHEWTEYIITLAKTLLKENISNRHTLDQYDEISNYCRGLTYNMLNLNSNLNNCTFIFNYDIKNWYDDDKNDVIDKFKFTQVKNIIFKYTDDEIKSFKNNMDIYGTSINGLAQVLKRTPNYSICRHPAIISP